MKVYKGFTKTDDGKLVCRGFAYEPGKIYKYGGDIELCARGYHACHKLHQTWQFYPNNGDNVFYEVECGGKIIESDINDGKFVCSEITLIKEVDVSDVVKFNDICDFSDGFAMVELDGKQNFINTKGELLSEQWFDCAWSFSEGFAVVELDGKQNFINTEGLILSEQWFDDVRSFSKGLAMVGVNWKYNFINTIGEILSKQWFDGARSFSGGFANVKLDGKWNFVNTEGKILSNQWFDVVWSFSDGFANVRLDGETKKINQQGEIV